MNSSLLQKIIAFFAVFYGSSTYCRSISKRGLKSSQTVLGEVYHYIGDEVNQLYEVDHSDLQQVPLRDLRTTGKVPDLNKDGFTYVSKRRVAGIEGLIELSDEHRDALEADSIELVKKLTGASSAFAYATLFRDHNSEESIKPVPAIHSDLSPEGAEYVRRRVQEVFLESKDPRDVEFGEHLGSKGVVILNVWRPIHTVRDNPLGLCKWDSLLKEDAPKWDIEPTDLENALQAWRYRKGQEWFYLSDQEPDEVYVFMQHDSRKPDGHGINVPHASFTLEKDRDEPPTRTSFETAIIAIVDLPRPHEGVFSRIQTFLNQFNWEPGMYE